MNVKSIGCDVACIIGGGLAGTGMGSHLAGDVGAIIGAIGGMLIGFGVSTWNQMPR